MGISLSFLRDLLQDLWGPARMRFLRWRGALQTSALLVFTKHFIPPHVGRFLKTAYKMPSASFPLLSSSQNNHPPIPSPPQWGVQPRKALTYSR